MQTGVETWDLTQQRWELVAVTLYRKRTGICCIFHPARSHTAERTHNKYLSASVAWVNCSLLRHLMASSSTATCPSLCPQSVWASLPAPGAHSLWVPIACSAHPVAAGPLDLLNSYRHPLWAKALHSFCLQIDLKYILKGIVSLIHLNAHSFSSPRAPPGPSQPLQEPLGESRAYCTIQMLYCNSQDHDWAQCKSLWITLYWKQREVAHSVQERLHVCFCGWRA